LSPYLAKEGRGRDKDEEETGREKGSTPLDTEIV
jgi:hypothetical protein